MIIDLHQTLHRTIHELKGDLKGCDSALVRSCAALLLICCLALRLPSLAGHQNINQQKSGFRKTSSHVVLITINGLGADFVNRPEILKAHAPFMHNLIEKGSHAYSAESVYPSLTLPAHASIVTGMLPADHSITADFSFDDPAGKSALQNQKKFLQASEIKGGEPIWETASRNGLAVASVGFPLTVGAGIKFNVKAGFSDLPDKESDFKPETLLAGIEPESLTLQLSSVLSKVVVPDKKRIKAISHFLKADLFRAAAASLIMENYKPGLMLVNLGSFAEAEEHFGLSSGETFEVLESIDRLIAQIAGSLEKGGIQSGTTLIIASDRGYLKTEQSFNPNVLLAKKGFLSTDGDGKISSWRAIAQSFGGSAAIFINPAQDEQLAGQVFKIFNDYYQKADSPIWRIINRREAVRLGADPIPAFYIDAAPGHSISARILSPVFTASGTRAVSGGLPSRAEIRAVLILSGSGIKPGFTLEYARLIDIAPTIARLFGIEMRTVRGRVLSEAIVQ